MSFTVEFKPKAVKDLAKIPREAAAKILGHISTLEDGLKGDIKRLTNFTPEYRLRVGHFRVLFEVEGSEIVVYRVVHRREAYR